jgi:ABC-type Na+ efflux pump permease subunit
MYMLALPIARRELLVLSRAAATWRNRAGTSLAVLLLGMVFAMLFNLAGQMALNQLMRLIGVGLSLMCLFMGVSLTADSIAEEKRSGTLGLLFLTNLSPFEIVLGKLIAHGALGFYTVLCVLPLLSLSMIFGGMRFADVLLHLVSALNLLFFSAAVGLFASSICREKRRANSVGTSIVVIFGLLLPWLALVLSSAGASPWLLDVLRRASVNPFGFGMGRLPPSASILWNLIWPQILGWALIGLAAWRLRRWHDEPAAKRWRLRDAWKAISYGRPAARLKLRRKLLDRNPFMWLASRDRLQIVWVWLISLSVIVFVASHWFRGPLQPLLPIGTGIVIGLLLQLGFGQAAAAQLLREYEQGTLELILSTPLAAHEVILGQIAAMRRQYRSLFAATLVLLWMGLLLLAWQRAPGLLLATIVLAVFSGLFLLQFHVLGWVSIWSVVKAPVPKKAAANGFFLVVILPALIFGAIVAAMNLLPWLLARRAYYSPPPQLLVPLFFILAVANCIYWLRCAKRELPQQLRLFAFRRYTPGESLTFFGRLGKFLGRCLAASNVWPRVTPTPASARRRRGFGPR